MKSAPIALVMVAMVLASCSIFGSDANQSAPQSAEAVYTAAAQTAEVRRLMRATETSAASSNATMATSPAGITTAGLPTAITAAAATRSPNPAATQAVSSPPVSADDRAEFVGDVSVPDGTNFAPNDPFVKTWRIKNTGVTTWTTNYALVFIDGALMGGASVVPLPSSVEPGATIDLSINLVAPAEDGIYQGFWKLRNDENEIFGVGPEAADAIWLIIGVSVLTAPVNTSTPTLESGSVLGQVVLSVDPPTFDGTCPHSFIFTGQFTLNQPATVTYSLEAGDDAATDIKLPLPVTRNLEAGTHTAMFELVFANSITGWARLRFTAPEELISNKVDFLLKCQ